MSKADLAKLGLKGGDRVSLKNVRQPKIPTSTGWYVVPYDIPEGSIATYFPESNHLIPINSVADHSNTPTSKSVMIEVISSRLS